MGVVEVAVMLERTFFTSPGCGRGRRVSVG